MPRTTINIDPTILRRLKERQRREGKSLGQLVSQLLASSLAEEGSSQPPPFRWTAKSMAARVDLEDQEAVRRALEQE